MEQSISKDVQERLNNINWDDLKNKYGISRDSLNPFIASQLAYGQFTDLVPGSTEDLSGMFSLRAYPQGEGEPWKVKVYTMERPKSQEDTLYLYKQPITSDSVKKALLERTDWPGNDGQRKFGYANANGGRPIAIEIDGKKQLFLISIHQPTNRIVGMPVEQVKAFFLDKDGASRGKGMYGVQFTDEQAKALQDAYIAERDAELARAERERSTQQANILVSQEVDKQRVIIAAEAEAEQKRINAKGEADAIFARMEAEAKGYYEILTKQAAGYDKMVQAAGGDAAKAFMLLMSEKMPELVKTQVEAIKGVNIDHVTVWDSGNNPDGKGSTANFLSGLMKSVPPMSDLFDLAGLSLPEYLAKKKAEGAVEANEDNSNKE